MEKIQTTVAEMRSAIVHVTYFLIIRFWRSKHNASAIIFCPIREGEKKKMNRTTRTIAMIVMAAMILCLAACGQVTVTTETTTTTTTTEAAPAAFTGVEDGVLTVAMECAYEPYNWAQPDDSNGAVPIKGSDMYANGYDVMMAKKLCEANGWELEVVQLDWDSLIPAVMTGTIDAVIAGQSMTAERMESVDFAGPYLYASIVCVTLEGSNYANATGISDLAGGTATSQMGTVWYDSCLPQIANCNIATAAETAPAMLMALETGTVDFICTDMPTALGAVQTYPDMKILDFSESSDNFQVSDEEINIGISIMKGNTVLLDALNSVLSTMTASDFDAMMAEAIATHTAVFG